MLDDQQHLWNVDRSAALKAVSDQAAQLSHDFNLDFNLDFNFQNLVLAGMGGSALAGEFVRSWLSDSLKQPFVITRGYELPAFVSKDSLVIVSSYSGNTEETLAAFDEAKKKQAQIVAVSAGGKLEELCEAEKLPHIKLPGGCQPRLAVFYGVKALATLFDNGGLTKGLTKELAAGTEWLERWIKEWGPGADGSSNAAKQVAQELHGSVAVIYAGPVLAYAARKWKIDFNENSKNAAFFYELPEFNHNEFMGWRFPADKPLRAVELISDLDHERVNRRWDISNHLLAEMMPEPVTVRALGKTKLEQMLWATLLGDFVSVYLAILNGMDPTPVDLIEQLKKELE